MFKVYRCLMFNVEGLQEHGELTYKDKARTKDAYTKKFATTHHAPPSPCI